MATSLKGMLTIEAFIDADSDVKLQITQNDMKGLNQQISKELQSIIPHLDESSFAIVGGLYQSSELLQPGFPIHGQLKQYVHAALKGENNRRNQLVIGASNGHLPKGLKQKTGAQMTPLLLMPFVIVTDNKNTQSVFETQLMHKGMSSKELLIQLQNHLNVKIRHVNFMTILDLAAMMHNHMQMIGFDALWQLLEQALFNEAPEIKVKTPQLNEFYLSKKIVFSPFFSYHQWCQMGPDNDLPQTKQAYLQYTQVQRQYIATLKEHGLDVRQFIAGPENWPLNGQHICFATLENSRINGDFHHEVIAPIDEKLKPMVDKHEHPQLGLLYYQVSDEKGGLAYYYPMNSEGVKQIEALLKT